ncbi:hypothetical protein [Streptomyces sp. SPB162]|uniref:hypothetical protein n=1 Tax=Streptomyces sp. SPB162 TaxID=2940560 RepID=UPI002404D113|nr:hypothetical protein [Streptomyces sp. SPB162]
MRDLLEHRSIPDGMPLFLDEDMRPVAPVCHWFRAMAYERRDPETMRKYAYIVRRVDGFLTKRETGLLGATEADLVAYRRSRTELQEEPVDGATWDTEAVVINLLYTFLVDQGYLRRKPLRVRRGRPSSLGSGMVREMQVRHMTVEQYLYLRDVGFGGQLPGAEIDETFRGHTPHRGKAGLEFALLTGARKQEWSTLLMPEVGEGWRQPGESLEIELQECAKYKLARKLYVPAAAVEALEMYFLLERAETVAKAARTLARQAAELFIVDRVDAERGKLYGVHEGVRRTYTMSAMSPALRRITVREGEAGLEPLAVFVGQGGKLLGPNSWDRLRGDAWLRMRAHAEHHEAPPLPRKRWRFHDARHTYALQLLKYLMRLMSERDVDRARAGGLPTTAEHMAFNPLLVVQRRLGHKRLSSTYTYLRYLEDPMNYVDDAFREWSEHDGATYADIALRALSLDGTAA